MLEEYKRAYEELAYSQLPNWKEININNIINSYIKYKEENPKLAQSYLGAIFCNYWHYISYFYNKSKNSKVSIEDCYSWLVDGIVLCLDYKAWLNPENKLYMDPNGPDKAMNVSITTYRQAFYQYSNYSCRRINYEAINTGDILAKLSNSNEDDDGSSDPINNLFRYDEKEYDSENPSIKDFIINNFNKGNYFLAFMLDNICYYSNVFKTVKLDNKYIKKFSRKKLCKCMHRLDERYVNTFSITYKIDKNIVTRAIKENIRVLNTNIIRRRIDSNLSCLKEILGNRIC